MSVLGVKEHPDSPVSAVDGPNGVTIVRRFIVHVSGLLDGPATVLAAALVPRRGDSYDFGSESNPYLYCTKRTPRRFKQTVWHVDCEYSPLEAGQSPDGQQQPNREPVFDPPQISMPSVKRQVDMRKDRNNFLVVNGAGDPLTPHPKKDVTVQQLNIVRNEPVTVNPVALKDAYVDKLNENPFWGRPAERWKCESITPENGLKVIEGRAFPFLKMTYVFQEVLEGEFEYLNWGYRYVSGTYADGPRAGQLKKVAFKTGDGFSEHGFLTGAKFAEATGGLPAAEPNYLTFNPYPTADFDKLRLPSSFIDALRI